MARAEKFSMRKQWEKLEGWVSLYVTRHFLLLSAIPVGFAWDKVKKNLTKIIFSSYTGLNARNASIERPSYT